MSSEKGQAALEYLMTYGWALIAILIVAAVLFAIGILNPESYQTGTCRGFGKIGYFDHSADDSANEFKIILGNGSGGNILSNNATVYLDSDRDGSYEDSTSNSSEWGGSEFYTFTLSSTDFRRGERYIVDIWIIFEQENGLEKEETAVCSGIAK
jgi:hypothetical protein